MRVARAQKVIGMPIPATEMAEIFTRLDLPFTTDGSTFTVRTAPWAGHRIPFVFLTDKATTTPDPKITNGNITVSNGVIHVVDRVLLPMVS